jgi:Na+/pantothenate symporter
MMVAVSVAFIGVSARVLYPNLETPDLASPTIAMEVLPPILGGLLLAAIQSTVSAVLLMLGSAISHDIMKQVMGVRLSERTQVNVTRPVSREALAPFFRDERERLATGSAAAAGYRRP